MEIVFFIYSELDDLLSEKRSLNPEHVLDSETELEHNDLPSSEQSNSSISGIGLKPKIIQCTIIFMHFGF